MPGEVCIICIQAGATGIKETPHAYCSTGLKAEDFCLRQDKEVETMSHEWGNYPEDFTPQMYWGARAILEKKGGQPGKELRLLPDRQSFEQLDGSQQDSETFSNWINTKVLPELRQFSREDRFHVWEDTVMIQSEDDSFVCEATPKNSGGEYLYIGCWEAERKL